MVGGNLSDSACFLWNKNHLCSLTLLIWVPRKYSKHTSFSMAAKVEGRGCEVPPRSARASTQTLSASENALQQASLPFPAGPRARTMEQRGIFRCRCPLPVWNRVSSHRSACGLSANTNTSMSGETMSILVGPDTAASTACSSSFVSPPPGCCQGIACLYAFLYIYYPMPPSHVNPLQGLSPAS